uniref:glycosyltransferase n=1 Tax=Synechococcus sp. UW106 TaxID=368495 RepID=UPI000E0EBA5F|nr:glycosyltransferase [Synechococcus sp. UW106]
MNSEVEYELWVYIGPVSLCPKPEKNRPFLVITGDQDEATSSLTQKRINRSTKASNITIKQYTIGRTKTKKTWHKFKQSSLNGISRHDLVEWYNSEKEYEYIGWHEVKNKKLLEILKETSYAKDNFHLIIAQGDPYLTLRRSKETLRNCLSIDLSLHPLGLIWKEEIDNYLKKYRFEQVKRGAMTWKKVGSVRGIEPLSTPSISEQFLDPKIQEAVEVINFAAFRKAGIKTKHLRLVQQVMRLKHQAITDLRSKIQGHIDELRSNWNLRGWLEASGSGNEPINVTVIWEEKNLIVGQGEANIVREDLEIDEIRERRGFEIELKGLKKVSLEQILNKTISLKVIESNRKQTVNLDPWILDVHTKEEILKDLLSHELTDKRKKELKDYIKNQNNQSYLLIIRQHIIKFSATQCLIGLWTELPVLDVIKYHDENAGLNHGTEQESASRIEYILVACIKLIQILDKDNIFGHFTQNPSENKKTNNNELEKIEWGIKERSYVTLKTWEFQLLNENILQLMDTLIYIILTQNDRIKLDNRTKNLLDVVASSLGEIYQAKAYAYKIHAILKAANINYDDHSFGKSAYKYGDNFAYLLNQSFQDTGRSRSPKSYIYYAATIEFATLCPAIHRNITDKLQETAYNYLEENPGGKKHSFWAEKLGLSTDTASQILVQKMLTQGFSRKSIIDVQQYMIKIQKDLVNILWCNSHLDSKIIKSKEMECKYKKWLIIGEKSLDQCWMYRVKQKKTYLEGLGCEVRCVDKEELRSWSFTHNIIWADAIIFCRLPAQYPYLRAVSFAKHCGKRTYAEIDDLIFTSDYPSEYDTYGGSISLDLYKNLCADFPLRLGILNAADEVIVSTNVLADYCKDALDDKTKLIHILPNLPLEELELTSSVMPHKNRLKSKQYTLKIAVTSGTLSHKKILSDWIFPLLIDALKSHENLELVVIGRIVLTSSFKKYLHRINCIPYTNYSEYISLLSQASIALVPLEIHPTTHAKSAIKWMEASLCGAACICSPVQGLRDITTDQVDVMFASTKDEWHEKLRILIENPEIRNSISKQSRLKAKKLFKKTIGNEAWTKLMQTGIKFYAKKKQKKVLLINVFFAPQSIGGATRVAQDYVKQMLSDPEINYDITILCVDNDRWQRLDQTIENEKHDYRTQISIDYSNWNGAKVIRLNMDSKPWKEYQDKNIENFCKQFFEDERFDLIQCHCCQILTVSPLVAAQKLGIPYEVVIHDAWWISEHQFLVSPTGQIIDPSDPFGHFDKEPRPDEKEWALARREFLYNILEGARRRITVSGAFKKVCEAAGIQDIEVRENKFTLMNKNTAKGQKRSTQNVAKRICHIGGMSLHKGYQVFREAVHKLPTQLNFEITIVDHRLASSSDEYEVEWNNYKINFIAPIPMGKMEQFYSSQDVLVAPSIWPESFGLVTREALSAGLWVIASDTGALAEPLLESKTKIGQIIRPNNVDDLIQALIKCHP